MDVKNLKEFTKGWIYGNFSPTLKKDENVEVAVKEYSAGQKETPHYHKIATEYTIVVKGKVKMNNFTFEEGEIIIVKPMEVIEFESIYDSVTVVIKTPCVIGDKYEV